MQKAVSLISIFAIMFFMMVATTVLTDQTSPSEGDRSGVGAMALVQTAEDVDVSDGYEAHVFAPERLPHEVSVRGAELRIHPRLNVDDATCSAPLFGQPKGWEGGAKAYGKLRDWRTFNRARYRIPDAMEFRPMTGAEVLYELKCLKPWSIFQGGEDWSYNAQRHFAGQACAYLRWAKKKPGRRVIYGFCGLAPPWAEALLATIASGVGHYPEIREMYYASGYEGAERNVLASMRDSLRYDLAPDQ